MDKQTDAQLIAGENPTHATALSMGSDLNESERCSDYDVKVLTWKAEAD